VFCIHYNDIFIIKILFINRMGDTLEKSCPDIQEIYNSINFPIVTVSPKSDPVKNRSTVPHIDNCKQEGDRELTIPKKKECEYKCKELTQGFDYPVYYEGIGINYKGGKVVKSGSGEHQDQLDGVIDQMGNNLIGALITGERVSGSGDLILGKNYVYPMDYELKVPLTDMTINADCYPKKGDYNRKQRYMYIRGIPTGDVAANMGITINLPEEPIINDKSKSDWTTLISSFVDKDKLKPVLDELKQKCFSFLYDTQSKDGVWSPQAQLVIPPECKKNLKQMEQEGTITTDQLQLLNDRSTGSLRGLLPSIVEDVVDILPWNLAEKSGIFTDGVPTEKNGIFAGMDPTQQVCHTPTRQLGVARYGEPELQDYTFETFSSPTNNISLQDICLLFICIIIIILISFYI